MVHDFGECRPYTSLRQFRREIGKYVNETEVARLEHYVFVPINLNTASDEAILSIPGLGDRMLRFGRGFTTANLLFRRAVAEGLCPVFSTLPKSQPGANLDSSDAEPYPRHRERDRRTGLKTATRPS